MCGWEGEVARRAQVNSRTAECQQAGPREKCGERGLNFFKLGGRQVSGTIPKGIVTNANLWGIQDHKETCITA